MSVIDKTYANFALTTAGAALGWLAAIHHGGGICYKCPSRRYRCLDDG